MWFDEPVKISAAHHQPLCTKKIVSSPKELAESLVPGQYEQVQTDILAFPEPVLDLMNDYGIRVAVLDEGKSMAESPALRHLTEEEYSQERQVARTEVKKGLSEFQGRNLFDFAEKHTRQLRKLGLEFHYGISHRELTETEIAASQGISESDFGDWSHAYKELNKDMPPGLHLLPHVYHEGKPIPENRLRSARETTAEYVKGSLGLNRADERLVLVHQDYTSEKAPEVGNYRLVIHEMGHALDHILDRVTGLPGFGTLHRQTVDRMYEEDLKKAETQSVEDVFTTTRASENVREYFAEAVEAYLTYPKDDGGDFFREANSNPGLRSRNLELYNYLDHVMSTDFSDVDPPTPPVRALLPDFVPDPDNAVVRL